MLHRRVRRPGRNAILPGRRRGRRRGVPSGPRDGERRRRARRERVDAVANVVDDDIVNHAPFEDSDDDDDDDGRELSLRVMQLEYLPSMHALVALTPRRGVTIHHPLAGRTPA